MEFRKILCDTLRTLMKEDKSICLLDADLARPNGTFPLYQEFPDRCFNVGIAEANMASIASGLSAYGFKPIIVTFAPFATRRICDQIAVSIAYAKQKVVIIGTDPGITAELNGGTHMSFEDIAVIRSIPTMVVYDAPDPNHFKAMLPMLIDHPQSVYIRMPRKERPDVFEHTDHQFMKASVVKKGKDLTVIASGTMVHEAQKAINQLDEYAIELISLNFIKPLDQETLLASIKKTNKVLVCENHNIVGGAFSAIAEMCALNYPVKIASVAINDQFGQVGKYDELLVAYQLTSEDIKKKIKEMMKNEK